MFQRFFFCFIFGGWLGVALSGNVYDWYWWLNCIGLNIMAALAYSNYD